MKIIKRVGSLRKEIKKLKQRNKTIGFVPTMGALHEGHASLMRRARKENDCVVAGIFVNPAQFAPKEDFRKYPRNLERDAILCRKAGVDLLFYPDAKEMYPPGYRTYIYVTGLSEVLCGKFRPGHFRGVATVVTKLFNLVSPDIAYFGQKDAQQAVIIERMAFDLNMPLKIKIMPTVREKDGLALSSRNAYLSDTERKDAPVLWEALNLAKGLIKKGVKDSNTIIGRMKRLIKSKGSARIDYVSIVDKENLSPVRKISSGNLVTLAVWIGKTRLIDNLVIQ